MVESLNRVESPASGSALDGHLLEQTLECLGVAAGEPDLDTLNRVYAAWCRAVPFDNIYKRLHFARNPDGLLPLGEPEEVLSTFLTHGTGGTCWPLAIAHHAILSALGYRLRGVAGSMVGITPPGFGPSHGTIIVTIDDQEYLVDNTIMAEEILPLSRDSATRAGRGGLAAWAEPNGELWDVHFRMAHSDREITCHLHVDNVGIGFFQERLQLTREYSRFNEAVYIRKNRGGGAIAFGRGQLTTMDPDGGRSVEAVRPERVPALLVDEFGLSAEIVAALPPDGADAGEILGDR